MMAGRFDTPRGVARRLRRFARKIIDATIEVHRLFGPGLIESICEEALKQSGLRTGRCDQRFGGGLA